MVIGCHRHPQDITSTPDCGHATLPPYRCEYAKYIQTCQWDCGIPLCMALYHIVSMMRRNAIWCHLIDAIYVLNQLFYSWRFHARWRSMAWFETLRIPAAMIHTSLAFEGRPTLADIYATYEMCGTFTWLSLGKWIQGDAVVTLNFTWWHLRMHFNVL